MRWLLLLKLRERIVHPDCPEAYHVHGALVREEPSAFGRLYHFLLLDPWGKDNRVPRIRNGGLDEFFLDEILLQTHGTRSFVHSSDELEALRQTLEAGRSDETGT